MLALSDENQRRKFDAVVSWFIRRKVCINNIKILFINNKILPKQFHKVVVQLAGELGHLRDNLEVTDSPVSLTTKEQVGLVRLR